MSARKKELAERFMAVAEVMRGQSACVRGQHACVLVDREMRIVSVGYNGPAASLPNRCQRETSPCGCVHAEANAVLQPRQSQPHYAFITAAPCEMCAQLLRNVGVRMVVYAEVTEKGADGLRLLQNSGVGSFSIEEVPAAIFGLSAT